jgi:hypothetical protein
VLNEKDAEWFLLAKSVDECPRADECAVEFLWFLGGASWRTDRDPPVARPVDWTGF